MKKRVNINAPLPIYTLVPAIIGSVRDVEMSVGDIRVCICGKAFVDEILKDGTTIRLTLSNYDKDNSKYMKNKQNKLENDKNINNKKSKQNKLENDKKFKQNKKKYEES